MSDVWHERLSAIGWFVGHLDDVLSDMSVFHRVDDIDQLPSAVFWPRVVRLPVYDGAVRFALLEAPAPERQAARPAPAEPTSQPKPHTRGQLAALNGTREYGPLGLNQQVGVFDLG